ncbi:hypothetical protein EJB05_11892, partial [Eragrostis curvula]
MDRISGLPDDLLHIILVRLRSSRAAARTSLLSRRWRRVWVELPEIFLGRDDASPPASFAGVVDAAVAAFSAPSVEYLEIHIPSDSHVSARGIAPWLRFASERLVGTLFLCVNCHPMPENVAQVEEEEEDEDEREEEEEEEEKEEVELPVCEKAKEMTLFFGDLQCRSCLRPAAGSFAALTDLVIQKTRMEARALEALVSTQCPRLKNLTLDITLLAASDVSLHSQSLIFLFYDVQRTSRLEVIMPRVEELDIRCDIEAHTISAPKLEEIKMNGFRRVYYPCRHDQIVDLEHRRLRLLEVSGEIALSFLKMFDKVDELRLDISIYMRQLQETKQNFVDETDKLPRCETLHITWSKLHGFAPTMLHLLRKCNGIRKLTVEYCQPSSGMSYCSPPVCGCGLPRSLETSHITLGSLEVVEIKLFYGSFSQEIESFAEHLSKCSATLLEKVVINCTSPSATAPNMEAFEKLNSMCRPNFRVEINMISGVR